MTHLCITIREKTPSSAIEAATRCRSIGIRLVEIRLDHFERTEWSISDQRSLADLGLKSIITLRPAWEGGMYSGSEEKRFETMKRMICSCPDLIDIELGMDETRRTELIGLAKDCDVGTIISHHDYARTPGSEELEQLFQKGSRTGGDIVKLATRCGSIEDASRLIRLASMHRASGKRFSVMGMGPYGQMTRVLAPILGCEVVYTKLDDPSNEDQIDARTLIGIWDALGIGGHDDRC
jgi:3-dehydroquinate dehydratase type I